MNLGRTGFRAAVSAVVLLMVLAWANHFENGFHFDDTHTILENPWIRDLRNIPKFFTDGNTFSTLPPNRSYRPVVSTSLAIDYRLSRGLHPLWFHITTFAWFLLQLVLMFILFRKSLDDRAALFAVALYGVHPVIAETVNYIIQRADIYSTLGVVAALIVYVKLPSLRKYGLYLAPAVAGILGKPTAAVFPILLFAWIWLMEAEAPAGAALRTLPSLAVCGAAAVFVARMTPPTFVTGAASALAYRITQPYVLLGYFVKFFAPLGLSADTDRVAFQTIGPDAITGFLFIALVVGFLWWSLFGGGKSRSELRPIAFGLVWFLAASLPTSWIPLAEVENDHRMYFPFVGLAFAVCQAGALLWSRHPVDARIVVPVCGLLLAALAWGTRERNEVWHTDESLWRDVTEKSPRNGRGLMNYGLTQMAKGNFTAALDLYHRAEALTPNYYILEINLGIVYGSLNDAPQAEAHFIKAVALAPEQAAPRYYYARWLSGMGRGAQAAELLRQAIRLNPDYLDARYLLMQLDANAGDADGLRDAARDTLARFPTDSTAAAWLKTPPATPELFLAQSLAFFKAGRYADCVTAAEKALKLRPGYAEAWNNVGACSNSLGNWEKGIEACARAVQLKPDFQLAKNNLAWALKNKAAR
jgi:tetratricopeptide (TPR) repeat protein